jgi:hypothetical protein
MSSQDETHSSSVHFDATTLCQLQHVIAGHSDNPVEYAQFLSMLGINTVPLPETEP